LTRSPRERDAGPPDDDAGAVGTEAALDRHRLSWGSVGAAIVGWLRGGQRPVASTLADHGRLLFYQTHATHEHEHEHEHGPRLADRGGTPSPIRGPGEEELAAIVDRSARAVWDVWVAGTREPTWDELPERIRERVRASARAGLVASGLLPTGGAGHGQDQRCLP
jgi:hypothetical protein